MDKCGQVLYNFDNAEVTGFLTVHELGHSFVNTDVAGLLPELLKDTALFTPALAKALEPSYIGTWETCLIEHLVRLGEIRIARSMGDDKEEQRVRKLHVTQFKFILLPLLEKKIAEYENNRTLYPTFKSFLPEILNMFHELKPTDIDQILSENLVK
ncbi:DUF4932 domain-containing protein [Ferruginibacter paludis]|uniref:DUF4932 domain-containing protein n=1 Tax=Ferruginibacter paludis TaxID=1310417 RepID=UPI0025B54E9D|nr:DUF4932 domain-containing protein [Ferruginibacter paludis]MDN3658142.1 DUF4932 domain-containing protein [Ferruginibacter paludis]